MGYDVDPPTRRIDPHAPVGAPVAGVVRTPEQAYADEVAWRQEVLDRISSLRTGLILVGLLAALALGTGLYALLSDDDDEAESGPRGASATRVSKLESRLDSLEGKLGSKASTSAVAKVRQDQDALEERVAKVSGAATSGADEEQVSALQDEVQALEQRLDDLAAQQAATGGAEAGGDTP
jgi:hypothetical protein